MSDIVERLRGFYGPDTDNWLDEDEAAPLMREAADEIERLRADALHWAEYESETWRSMKEENERLRADVAAIRKTLEGTP